MHKLTVTFVLLLLFSAGFTQEKKINEADKAKLDSMLKNDEFLKMFSEGLHPKSYFIVSAGIGNSYFSKRNKRLNATQVENRFVLNPSVGYSHKSGFAITTAAFLSDFNGKSNFYQYTVSPSFSLMKSSILSSTISYTHTFVRNGYEKWTPPIQNEFFGNISLKKPWVQPGISLGWSGGKYTDYTYIDTVLNGTRRKFTDTAKTKASVFSMNAFIKHEFEFYGLFGKEDGIAIEPQVIVNAGAEKYDVTHYNPFLTKLRGRAAGRFKQRGSDNSSFGIQSLAFNLDINYSIGKFAFEPQLYLDYYFPQTTDQRFTQVYSFTVSYSF